MAKADRILGLLPSFFRAADPNTLFREVVTALSAPIAEADTLLFRIQRAHRVNVAEDAGDVARLAGLLDLDAQHFEDIHDDPALAYSERLDLMRARIRRIARLHLVGLGTPWAVLEAAAIFLNAEIVPEDRKSTRLNSSHLVISYAVFCLKKKEVNGVAVDTAAET